MRWLVGQGHLVLAVAGALAFVLVRPPVADLQAADARAAAAARGVGLSYWLSWYSGSAPGDYSILAPKLTAAIGVATAAALSVLAIALLARPVLAGSRYQRGATYLIVVSAVANLWSGRVPFSLAAAFGLAALLALRRGRPWVAGLLAALAATFSPLAPAFLFLGLVGPALTGAIPRGHLVRFAGLTLVGLALPAIAFGVPGPMPFRISTVAWTVGLLLAAQCAPLPRQLRLTLGAAVLVAIGLFLVPNGVGANLSRFAYLVAPPMVWAMSGARRGLVALAIVPALAYSGFNVVSDLTAAGHPAAQPDFYTGLHHELDSLPNLHDHRVEVIDTQTHRAAAELVPDVYLARGWEDQSDTAANPIFHTGQPLTAADYRAWLDGVAVAWVAVPSHPGQQYEDEAALVNAGLPYLHEVWHDSDWRLYSVQRPQPIVSGPAHLIQAGETTMTIDVTRPATVTLRIRPSKYLQLTGPQPSDKVCLQTINPTTVSAVVPAAGRYLLEAPFSVPRMLGDQDC
jgi:hypothetical protein